MPVRLHLGLRLSDTRRLLAYDYNYFLTAFIYHAIGRASPVLAEDLHVREHSKNFTFSGLWYESCEAEKAGLRATSNAAAITISFLEDNVAAAFLAGIYNQREMTLGTANSQVCFEIVEVEYAEPLRGTRSRRYVLLSPVLLSRTHSDSITYLGPETVGYTDFFTENLAQRAKNSGIAQRGKATMRILSEPKSRLVTIAKRGAETRVRGWQFAFELTAPPALHEFGYYAGFGSKCSMGFGCAEVIE